jgi:hypothetical protein
VRREKMGLAEKWDKEEGENITRISLGVIKVG